MNDDRDLRDRIAEALSFVDCEACRRQSDNNPSSCDNPICKMANAANRKRADAVMKVLPQPHGLSIKEQAAFLWALCRYSNNPESCPINLMRDLPECPFDEACHQIKNWAWLPILEKRVIPDTNK